MSFLCKSSRSEGLCSGCQHFKNIFQGVMLCNTFVCVCNEFNFFMIIILEHLAIFHLILESFSAAIVDILYMSYLVQKHAHIKQNIMQLGFESISKQ